MDHHHVCCVSYYLASEASLPQMFGEICIASGVLVCLSLYIHIYMYVRPDNQYHSHSHCARTLTL